MEYDPGYCPACCVEIGAAGKMHHAWCIWCITVKNADYWSWRRVSISTAMQLILFFGIYLATGFGLLK